MNARDTTTTTTTTVEETAMNSIEHSGVTAASDTPQPPTPVQVLLRAVSGFVALVAGLGLLGGLGSLFLFEGVVGDADADIVGWVADNRTDVFDTIFSTASTFSDTWTVIGVVVGAVSMLWAAGRWRLSWTILLAVALELSTFLVVGALIGRDRPDVEALNSVPSTPSFPSGHTAAAFVLYGSLVLAARIMSNRSVPRWVWIIPSFIGVLVAAARVYEGVHHPIDVAAGFLLGVAALTVAAIATGVADIRAFDPRRSDAGRNVRSRSETS